MPQDSYTSDDFFESENDKAFLEKQPEQVVSDHELEALEPKEEPLTVCVFEFEEESVEERILREKEKDRKKLDIDDTRYIKKEIEEAKREIAKTKYNYKQLSPRSLRAYANLYQEHALQHKCPGLRSGLEPNLLLIPIIENDGEREIVTLRSPIIGSLERHQLLADSKIVKMLVEYYHLQKAPVDESPLL